jgi:hypothetical protein
MSPLLWPLSYLAAPTSVPDQEGQQQKRGAPKRTFGPCDS